MNGLDKLLTCEGSKDSKHSEKDVNFLDFVWQTYSEKLLSTKSTTMVILSCQIKGEE